MAFAFELIKTHEDVRDLISGSKAVTVTSASSMTSSSPYDTQGMMMTLISPTPQTPPSGSTAGDDPRAPPKSQRSRERKPNGQATAASIPLLSPVPPQGPVPLGRASRPSPGPHGTTLLPISLPEPPPGYAPPHQPRPFLRPRMLDRCLKVTEAVRPAPPPPPPDPR